METALVNTQAQPCCEAARDFAEERHRQCRLVAQADSTDAALHPFTDEALMDVEG